MSKKRSGIFGPALETSVKTSWELKQKYAPYDDIEVRAVKYPKHRYRTVRGFSLGQQQRSDGSWRYDVHGETGRRVRQLRRQGHGRELDKALE